MTYTIGISVKGVYYAKVEADSVEEAARLAEREFSEADFGELELVDGEVYTVDDENGNFGYLY